MSRYDSTLHGDGLTLAQSYYITMLQIDKKPNLNLATLAEAINILRDVLRRYVTEESCATDDQLLKVMESSSRLQEDPVFRKEVDAFKRGHRDIEDLIDISIVGRFDPNLVEKHISYEFCLHFREIKRSAEKVTNWRNKVCHPPYRGISNGELRTGLDRIINLLERIGAYDQELRTVVLLREKPFTQIHYHEARENRDLKYQVAQLQSSVKGYTRFNAQLKKQNEELEVQVQGKTGRQDKKIKELESRLDTSTKHADQEASARQVAEEQVAQLEAYVIKLESRLASSKEHTGHEREAREAAEAQVARLEENVKELDSQLVLETEARNRYHSRANRRGVAGIFSFVIASVMVSVLALAVFQPKTFLQVLAPFRPELITTTEIVEELIAIQSVLQERAEELASVRSALQDREAELAAVQTELATHASTVEELKATQSQLANAGEELRVVQVALQDAEEELAVIQVASVNKPDTVLAVPTHVYTGPGTEYESRWVLPAGAPIRIIGTDISGDWSMLSSRYWIPVGHIEGQVPGNLPVRTSPSVLANVANLREEPTSNSPVGETVSAGQTIVLVGQKEGGPPAGTWYQLDSGLWIWGNLVADAPSDLPVLP